MCEIGHQADVWVAPASPPSPLSLIGNTISILIDAPMGFGWTQLRGQPYPGNHFKAPLQDRKKKGGRNKERKKTKTKHVLLMKSLGKTFVRSNSDVPGFICSKLVQFLILLHIKTGLYHAYYIKMLKDDGLCGDEILITAADKENFLYFRSPFAHHQPRG